MPNVGVLIFFAIVGSLICARARVAGGAVVFAADRARAVRDHAARRGSAGRAVALPVDGQPRHRPGPERPLTGCRMNARREWRSDAACRRHVRRALLPDRRRGRSGLRRAGRGGQGRLRRLPGPGRVPRRGPGPHPGGDRGRTDPRGATQRLRRPPRGRRPTARTETRCGEREAAGRVLLAAGRPIREVARRCGVSERTAARWAARLRAAPPPPTRRRRATAATGLPS